MKTVKKCLAAVLTATMLVSLLPVSTLAAPKVPKAKKLTLSKKKITMEEGEEIYIKTKGKADVKATVTPKKAKQGIKVTSSDKDVVKPEKIKNGYKLTAGEAGEAKITVTSLSNKKLKQRLKITVLPLEDFEDDESEQPEKPVVIFSMSARQSAESKIEVMFTEEVSETVALSAFKLRDKTGNSEVALKTFRLRPDKRSGEIESHISFNTGSIYELSFLNLADGKTYTAEINAKKGDVATLRLLTTSVPVSIAKKINYVIYDVNGVDVTSSYKPFVSLSADIAPGKGFLNAANEELTMFDPGATAKIIMTYQEGSKKIEGSGIVSVTSQSTETVSMESWSLNQNVLNPLDWSKPNKVSAISIGQNTMNFEVAAKVTTSDGKRFQSDTDAGFTFKSSNESVFRIMGNSIVPITKGTAVIIVEFIYEGKTSKFTPITVTIGDDAKPTVIMLNKDGVMVKKGQTDTSMKVTEVKDQYGNFMSTAGAVWVLTVNPAAGAPAVTIGAGDIITADATGGGVVENKSYNVKMEMTLGGNKLERMFNVIVTP